jgi:hypothetical protein
MGLYCEVNSVCVQRTCVRCMCVRCTWKFTCTFCCKIGIHEWIMYHGKLNCMLCQVCSNCIQFNLSSHIKVHIFKLYTVLIFTTQNLMSTSNLNLNCSFLTVCPMHAVGTRARQSPTLGVLASKGSTHTEETDRSMLQWRCFLSARKSCSSIVIFSSSVCTVFRNDAKQRMVAASFSSVSSFIRTLTNIYCLNSLLASPMCCVVLWTCNCTAMTVSTYIYIYAYLYE